MFTKVETVTMLSAFCSLGEKNKTRTDRFGHRTDMLQRQQNIAPEQHVLQKSAEWTQLRIWMRPNSQTPIQQLSISSKMYL